MGEGELGELTGLVVEVPGAPRCLWLTSGPEPSTAAF